MFQNYQIKKNRITETPEDFIDEFVYFITDKYTKEVSLRKSEKGKEVWKQKMNSILKVVKDNDCLPIVVETVQLITQLKLIFIKKLHRIFNICQTINQI